MIVQVAVGRVYSCIAILQLIVSSLANGRLGCLADNRPEPYVFLIDDIFHIFSYFLLILKSI